MRRQKCEETEVEHMVGAMVWEGCVFETGSILMQSRDCRDFAGVLRLQPIIMQSRDPAAKKSRDCIDARIEMVISV